MTEVRIRLSHPDGSCTVSYHELPECSAKAVARWWAENCDWTANVPAVVGYADQENRSCSEEARLVLLPVYDPDLYVMIYTQADPCKDWVRARPLCSWRRRP